jgi:hypothetical protein
MVPFAFVVNGKAMPAGDYVMGRTGENVMSVRSERGDSALVIVIATRHASPVNAVNQPKLVFVRKNGQYHLKEIHMGGVTGGEQIAVK